MSERKRKWDDDGEESAQLNEAPSQRAEMVPDGNAMDAAGRYSSEGPNTHNTDENFSSNCCPNRSSVRGREENFWK